MATQPEIVRLKITLDNVKPTVMRRIEVPVSTTLDTLHEMIQAIMPWDNSHLHAFYLHLSDGPRWSPPSPMDDDFGIDARDSTRATLAKVLAEPRFKVLRYNYDFGDDWHHTIKVERRFAPEMWDEYPKLIDAKGRCPPEDSGGAWGYAELLDDDEEALNGRLFDDTLDRAAIEAAFRRFATPEQSAKPTKIKRIVL